VTDLQLQKEKQEGEIAKEVIKAKAGRAEQLAGLNNG